LNCTKKNQITYQITGGGFTAEYDAVTFELLRNACNIYYNSSNDFFSGVNKDDYKLHGNDNASYTINLYLTKCSLLIIIYIYKR